jgi:hypothetical protein
MLTCGVVPLHYNTAACNRALLEHLIWELFDHLPYGPDFFPSDYHLLTYQKNCFRSQRFNNNELMESVETWFN